MPILVLSSPVTKGALHAGDVTDDEGGVRTICSGLSFQWLEAASQTCINVDGQHEAGVDLSKDHWLPPGSW